MRHVLHHRGDLISGSRTRHSERQLTFLAGDTVEGYVGHQDARTTHHGISHRPRGVLNLRRTRGTCTPHPPPLFSQKGREIQRSLRRNNFSYHPSYCCCLKTCDDSRKLRTTIEEALECALRPDVAGPTHQLERLRRVTSFCIIVEDQPESNWPVDRARLAPKSPRTSGSC
jgi:hypothetical protein